MADSKLYVLTHNGYTVKFFETPEECEKYIADVLAEYQHLKPKEIFRQSYLNYLADWIDRKSWADEHSSPLSYEKWQNRPVMLANANICVAMIEDLGEGEPTHLGERTSRYFHLARSRDGQPDRFCSAALIERTVLETGHEQEYYELHVINDIDMTSSRTYMTTYKSRLELSELVQSILKKIEEMTY